MPGERIARTPKSRASRFARIDNAVLQDKRLSFRARGILVYVLSMPTDWAHSAERLANVSPDGKDSIRGALRELAKFGYAELRREKSKRGSMVNAWYLYESPRAINPEALGSVKESGFKGAGEPDSGRPALGGMALLETMVGKTTIRKTTIHTQSAGEIKSCSFSLPEAEALADGDPPEKAIAWSQWVGYLGEKRMLERSTVMAQRKAFEQLGDKAPEAVANTIAAGLRLLCFPKTYHRPAVSVKALPDNLKFF